MLFHSPRQTLGTATLVLACAFMAGWVRSLFTEDRISFDIANLRNVLFSSEQNLGWGSQQPSSILWSVWTIPYWSIVIPLTLLSAYLLLSKQSGRPSTKDGKIGANLKCNKSP